MHAVRSAKHPGPTGRRSSSLSTLDIPRAALSTRALILLYAGTSLFLGLPATPVAAGLNDEPGETAALRPPVAGQGSAHAPGQKGIRSPLSGAGRKAAREHRRRRETPERGSKTSFQAANGFVLTLSGGRTGAVMTATSPWNETVTFHLLSMNDTTLEMTFGDTGLRSWSPVGSDLVEELEISSPLGHARQAALHLQARRFQARGLAAPDASNMETEAYTLLTDSALAEASLDFWRGLAAAADDFEAQLPSVIHAGCFTKGLVCAGSLLGWGATIAALIAACGATAGAGCIAAILFHEGAGAATIAACVEYAECLQ